ncbi:hypothetical protein EDC04DRAFT_2607208 [Pisolithus marmoratus]|nr:hypothetical protein EDC04DRAFT_2607208 [Pisolithus marmoratus]
MSSVLQSGFDREVKGAGPRVLDNSPEPENGAERRLRHKLDLGLVPVVVFLAVMSSIDVANSGHIHHIERLPVGSAFNRAPWVIPVIIGMGILVINEVSPLLSQPIGFGNARFHTNFLQSLSAASYTKHVEIDDLEKDEHERIEKAAEKAYRLMTRSGTRGGYRISISRREKAEDPCNNPRQKPGQHEHLV